MENYVFISFSSKNQDVADRLVDYLEQTEKIKCWICTRDIPAGTPYPRAINNAIANCSCALLILSQYAQRSDHVENELELLVNEHKPVIPCKVDDSPLEGTFNYYLHKQQAFTLDNLSEDKLALVAVALKKHVATKDSPKGDQRATVSSAECSSSRVTHEHTFSDSWTWDSTSHWHASTCGHDVVIDKAPHNFGNGKVCRVCGYDRTLKYVLNPDNQSYSVSCLDKFVTKVDIPNYHDGLPVTDIGERAFAGCINLTEIVIPSNVTNIGDWAFADCKLTEITIAKNITNIGENAFLDCSDLRTVKFDKNSRLKKISYGAFSDCTNLNELTIPNSVIKINDRVFSRCTGLKTVLFEEKSQLEYIGTSAFSYCSSLTKITIPCSIATIHDQAFIHCSNLQTVIFEGDSQLQSIGNSAFSGCDSLTEITVPSSVTSIGNSAYYYCDKLQTVTFEGNSQLQSIGEHVFYQCGRLREITIPSTVASIGLSAFDNCSNLRSVTFEGDSQLQSIGKIAFGSCGNLKEITIPSTVTSIDDLAFTSCANLRTVTFKGDSHLQSIGKRAFGGCRSLTEITIPSSVTNIGEKAFGCSKLTRVFFRDSRGWSYCDCSDSCIAISGFENAQTAARYLTDTYYAHDLFKRP